MGDISLTPCHMISLKWKRINSQSASIDVVQSKNLTSQGLLASQVCLLQKCFVSHSTHPSVVFLSSHLHMMIYSFNYIHRFLVINIIIIVKTLKYGITTSLCEGPRGV